jgi:hypothetical protein
MIRVNYSVKRSRRAAADFVTRGLHGAGGGSLTGFPADPRRDFGPVGAALASHC